MKYLQICLGGCKNFGEEFSWEFKKTTFIERKTVLELELGRN